MKKMAVIAVAFTFVAGLAFAARQPAAPHAGEDMAAVLPLHEVVAELSRKGAGGLVAIAYDDGAYRGVVRREDGRLTDIAVDARTGELRDPGSPDLLRNAIDRTVVEDVRGWLDGASPEAAVPAAEVARSVMAEGRYEALQSLRLEAGTWQVLARRNDGTPVAITIDAASGKVLGERPAGGI